MSAFVHMALSNRSPRVLCLSRDPRLLETRQQVLATRYEALTVGSIEEIVALTTDEEFDVILLCHTLSVEECDLSADRTGAVAKSKDSGPFRRTGRLLRGR